MEITPAQTKIVKSYLGSMLYITCTWCHVMSDANVRNRQSFHTIMVMFCILTACGFTLSFLPTFTHRTKGLPKYGPSENQI
jgi:hypothetical protein